MKIGVLALQGDFEEHISVLTKLGADASEVRLPEQLDNLLRLTERYGCSSETDTSPMRS